jgi:hypothetical protein
VAQLVAALADPRVLSQNAVHRAFRAEVAPLVEQRRVDLGRREIGEALLVQHVEHAAPLVSAEGTVGSPLARRTRPRLEQGLLPGEERRSA